jgi:hypothetical protein
MSPRLEDIPWTQLHHASGTAENVPNAIKSLTSRDEKTRERAYWTLDNSIVLQSDLYEAAPFAVPFLIDIVERRDYPGSSLAYRLLFEIANGWAPEDVKSTYRPPNTEGEDLSLVGASRLAVLAGAELYERDAIQDPRVRRPALELLRRLAEFSPEAAAIVESLKSLGNPDLKAALQQVLDD